jgi:hypothetical protein
VRCEVIVTLRTGPEHARLLGATFDVLARAIARKPSLRLSRRPRLADWGEYAAAVYEVMGWGAETFLSDCNEVVKAQNRSTLDGSPVAQAVIRFMEDRVAYEGTSTELHKKLEAVAEDIGVSVARDKAWPKSARWRWRRIQEVVPLLVAAGIGATRSEEKRGTVIALRKSPTDDATNATAAKNATGKPDTGGNTASSNATANATSAPNATANASPNPADRADGGITGNSGIRSGGFSGMPTPIREFLSKPAGWLQKQMDHCRQRGCPASQLKALAASVAAELYGYAPKGAEILPEVEAFMTHGVGCDCEVCR